MTWITRLLDWLLSHYLLDKLPAPAPIPPEPEPQPEPPPAPEPPPPEPEPEVEVDDQPPDGAFLWKPQGNDGNAAVICPYQYDFQTVTVYFGLLGQRSERGRYVGRGNGHRQTFRLSKPGARFKQKIKVVGRGIAGDRVWRVPDGAQRHEDRRP